MKIELTLVSNEKVSSKAEVLALLRVFIQAGNANALTSFIPVKWEISLDNTVKEGE